MEEETNIRNPMKRMWRTIYHKINLWWFEIRGGLIKPQLKIIASGEVSREDSQFYLTNYKTLETVGIKKIENMLLDNYYGKNIKIYVRKLNGN